MEFPLESLIAGNILKAMEEIWNHEKKNLSPLPWLSICTEQETNGPSQVIASLEGQ